MKEAMFYRREEAEQLRCTLCPRSCRIAPGKCGYCGVRRNSGGRLEALTWCRPAAVQIDPIEKKPLAFFLPGSRTFSLGTFGCNLGCVFCQNDELSRGSYPPGFREREVAPEEIVEAALRHGCRSVAFTYNEPTVFSNTPSLSPVWRRRRISRRCWSATAGSIRSRCVNSILSSTPPTSI